QIEALGDTPRARAPARPRSPTTSLTGRIRRKYARSSTSGAATAPLMESCVDLAVPARAAVSAPSATLAPRRTLRALAWRGVLRPFDQLCGLDERPVLVLRDELETDAATLLVPFLGDYLERVAARDHVLDVPDPAGPDVRDVQEAVRALLELDEGAEVGRLHDLAGVGV